MGQVQVAAAIAPARPVHVCIIGINYAPEETGIAPYTTGLAEHLVSRGYRVTMITGMPHYPSWQIFDGYRGHLRLRQEMRSVDIRRLRHYVPPRQSALQRGLYEATFLVQALTVTDIERPNLILGVTPSLSAGLAAFAASMVHRVPFGLIIQDLMGQAATQSGMRGGRAVAHLTTSTEGWVARKAAGVAIVAEAFRSRLEALGVAPQCIVHTPNWSHVPKPARPRDQVRNELGWAPTQQVVLHAGNMGLKQGLEHVVHTARHVLESRPHVQFVLMGNGNQRPYLESLAVGLPNVSFVDPQPKDIFSDILAAADVLLVNERPTVVDMSLPSKLTSYFVAGRPIVAAVDPHGATAREVRASGAGLIVTAGQPADMITAIDRLRYDECVTAEFAAAGADYVQRHLTPQASLTKYERFIGALLRQ